MNGTSPATPILDTQLFRDAFNASPIGIAVENLDGQPLFVNPAFCRFLGFTEEELRRKHCVDFSPKEDAEKDWTFFQQLRAGSIDHYQLEKRYFRRDGSLVWGSLSISLLNSRPSPLVIAMVEDITAQKTAEEAQFRHAAIVESSEDAIVSKNLDGIITSWSAGAERIFGYAEAEVIGHPITVIFPPELREEGNKILETLRAGGRLEHYETVRITKAGKKVDVSLSIYPIKDSTGKIEGISQIARDITDRKRAEEALHESEGRLRLAVQAGKMFAYSWDAASDVIERSGESDEILGVKSDQVATGAAVSAMVHPDDKQRFEVALSALNVENPTLRITYRIMRPDGMVRWLERNSRAYFDAHGNLKRIVGMIADVTERTRAEEGLLRYAAIVESSEDAIASGTLDGIIVSWNAGAQRMYGYTEEEAVGKPITILVPPELSGEENNILETLKAGGRIEQLETVRVTKTGKRINVSLSISPIRDSSGATVGVAGIARDITERKQAEQALREMNRALEGKNALLQSREELLRVFVKNVPVAVAMLDRELRYLQVSDRWCSDNSVESSEILGSPRHEAPEMPEHFKEANRRALQGETLRADEDSWESGGSTRWGQWEVRPWRNSDGTVGGILVFAEDITRRKQMEQELSEMTRKLIASQEQERTRIGRELHDDINQRLAMLAVELEQLQDNPAEVQTRLPELRKQTTELSNDVQALSHELHSSKLEYLGVVSGIRSWCKEFGERQNILIDFRSDVSSVVPLDIGISLFRVLQEALHNASKHSGVKRIEVQLREKSSEIHLIVHDSGTGFDIEAALQGKGLGLTSMRERVRLVNGTIAFDSKPMAGTTIYVRVPLESQQASQPKAV